MNNNILLKWKEYFQDNKKIIKELTRLENIKIEETDFLNPMNVIDEKISSSLGLGLNKLNKVTIRALTNTFINENDLSENDLILVASDGTKECIELIKSLAFLKPKNGKLITFEQYEGFDKKIVNETFKKINIRIGLYISQSVYNPSLYDIFLLNQNGENFDNEYVKKIVHSTHQNDYFLTQLLDIENMLFIETPIIIKMFVKKILPLYTKRISTDKTKFAISNHNKNVTEVISKILGNLDFSYVVNNNVKNEIPVYKNNKINDAKFKKMFRNEIRFAKKKKANVLISFSNNGNQLFCFIKIKNRFVYINENLITLLVLNNFFNDAIVNEKKNLPKLYISSNNYLNKSIQNLVNKFRINFKLINNTNHNNDSYLLFYWNNYNQFAFGEKNNKTFSIYHVLIKLIEIINVYNLQFEGIENILYDLDHMYSLTNETKYFSPLQRSKIISTLNDFAKLSEHELSKKYKIKSINNITSVDDYDEIIISNIKLINDDDLIIKWNYVINRAIFIHRYDKKHFNFILFPNSKYISIKKIIKYFVE